MVDNLLDSFRRIIMDYQQALDYLYSHIDYEKIPMPHALAHYDLRRVEELLARLGNPHLSARSVHVGGTNGKGSTSAMIASALTTSGYRTGFYSSPHLNTIRERFRVDGTLITEDELTSIVNEMKPEVERVNQQADHGQLTTFELLTALAFTYFKLKGVDFQVLEVGMGGKFDATNVILPEVSVITSISLDHMAVLGNSLAKIAQEKAGIIKPDGTLVLAPQFDQVAPVIVAACRDQKAELVMVGKDITWRNLGFDGNRQLLRVEGRLDSYELAISLLGQYQLENAATALASLEVLSVKGFSLSRDSITRGLAATSWAGRLQILNRQPLLVVDGAHNPDAARRLRQSLKVYFDFKRSVLVMGASSDKDVAGVVSELAPAFDRVIVTRSAHPRAMEPDRLKAEFRKYGVEARSTESIPEALSLVVKMAGPEDLVCATGSLFVVAEVIKQTESGTGLISKREQPRA